MEIREAVPSDSEAIRAVHRRSILELGPEGYAPEQVEAWAEGCESADYAAVIEAASSYFVVAEDDGEVVGFGTIQFDPEPDREHPVDAEVTGVYVHPAVAREGVGTSIYEALERRARERGAEVIGLSASLNAVAFYESHGYERVGERTHEFSSHESTGVEGTVVEMRKPL